jgi:hypothetical protein
MMSGYTYEEFQKKYPVNANPMNNHSMNHSTFKLPLIQLDDVKKMDDKEIATQLTKDDALKKSYEAKGYKWNEPVEKIKDIDRDGKALWLLFGSPTGGPLRSYIGLKPEVWKQMNLRISPVAGPGHRAVFALRAEKEKIQKGQSRRKSRRNKTIRMKKSDYLREHHHLFKVLSRPTRKVLARELKIQKKELKERGLKG